jgi:hypothetical protein
MKLLSNWREIITRAWSIRLIILAGILSAIEAVLPFIPQLYMVPRGMFALLTLAITFAALVARLVAQQSIEGDK